jgi:hypothetical protein
MFDKLRGKSPSGHSKKDSVDNAPKSDTLSVPAPPPAYTGSSSLTAPATTTTIPFQTRFASLSLHMEDRLRFLRFPDPIITLCRSSILSTWPAGIQEERPYASSHEMKLNGYPWRGYGKEAAEARRLMKRLLATLYAEGWVLCVNTDISKTATDKDTLLFCYQSPPPARQDWAAIAFSRIDRLRFIDFPSPSTSPLLSTLAARLGKEWIDKQVEYAPGVQEFKLNGYPWQATGKDTMRVRELLMVLVETLEEEGWSVYASIDQKGSGEAECDTWFCCRVKGWEREMGVYQR